MPDGTVLTARGSCEGLILREGRGTDGFGYDPLFYVPQEQQTFAQLPPERKMPSPTGERRWRRLPKR